MSYENPQIPEGINVSQEHPLKDFFVLLLGATGFFLAVFLALYLAANYLSPFIPFSAEQKAADYIAHTWQAPGDAERYGQHQVVERYLNEKAQLIVQAQGLSEEMVIQVHYMDDEVVNAFATLGGHVIMNKGLLSKLPNENALMMVLAHEIAHVKHRDPVQALGRGVALTLVMSLISGAVDSNSISSVFSQAGLLTALSFNREQERAADHEALETLKAIYGHTLGADALFSVLHDETAGSEPPEWFSSHPMTDERIDAAKRSHLNSNGELTDIPADVLKALQ